MIHYLKSQHVTPGGRVTGEEAICGIDNRTIFDIMTHDASEVTCEACKAILVTKAICQHAPTRREVRNGLVYCPDCDTLFGIDIA